MQTGSEKLLGFKSRRKKRTRHLRVIDLLEACISKTKVPSKGWDKTRIRNCGFEFCRKRMKRHPRSVYNGKLQTFTSWIKRLHFKTGRRIRVAILHRKVST